GADRAVRADADLRLQKNPVIELEQEIGSELAKIEAAGRGGTSRAVGRRGSVALDMAVANPQRAVYAERRFAGKAGQEQLPERSGQVGAVAFYRILVLDDLVDGGGGFLIAQGGLLGAGLERGGLGLQFFDGGAAGRRLLELLGQQLDHFFEGLD